MNSNQACYLNHICTVAGLALACKGWFTCQFKNLKLDVDCFLMSQTAVNLLEASVRQLGQQNAQLVEQLQEAIAAGPPPGWQFNTSADGAAAAGVDSNGVRGGARVMQHAAVGDEGVFADPGKVLGAAGGGGVMSPRMLHKVVVAATRVHQKNKLLKQKLQVGWTWGRALMQGILYRVELGL
jgi:hypothetical protein